MPRKAKSKARGLTNLNKHKERLTNQDVAAVDGSDAGAQRAPEELGQVAVSAQVRHRRLLQLALQSKTMHRGVTRLLQ